MNITEAIVFLRYASQDMVRLVTTMPTASHSRLFPNNHSPLDMYFYADCGTGETYVKTNFPGVPVRLVTLLTKEDARKEILTAFEKTFDKR